MEPGWYPYPGRIVLPTDTTITLTESRAFWGECLSDEPPGLFSFVTDFVDNEPLEQSVRMTLVRGDTLVSTDGLAPWSAIDVVTGRVVAGTCREIEPVDRLSDP